MLETKRLIVREWKPSDIEAALPLYADPEVTRFLGDGKVTTSLEKIERMLAKFTSHHADHGYSPLAVVEKSRDNLIGVCGLHHFNPDKEVEIGFRIVRSAWGRGYATEAASACVENGKKHFRFSRIIGLCHTENFASKKVLEKIGLRWERRVPNHDPDLSEIDLYSAEYNFNL